MATAKAGCIEKGLQENSARQTSLYRFVLHLSHHVGSPFCNVKSCWHYGVLPQLVLTSSSRFFAEGWLYKFRLDPAGSKLSKRLSGTPLDVCQNHNSSTGCQRVYAMGVASVVECAWLILCLLATVVSLFSRSKPNPGRIASQS